MKLYHYCPTDSFLSIIQNRSIRLSSLTNSNDAMEGKWIRNIFQRKCEEQSFSKSDVVEIMTSFDFIIEFTRPLGFCLTEEGDLLSQWRGYADDGQGMSIGFAKEFLDDTVHSSGNTNGYSLQQIAYGDDVEIENVQKVIKALKEFSDKGAFQPWNLFDTIKSEEEKEAKKKLRIAASAPLLLLMFELFKAKSPSFSEEKEWRLISYSFKELADDCRFTASNGNLKRYREYPLPTEGLNSVVEVVLGPKNTSDEDDVRVLLENNGFKAVNIVRSGATYR